MKRKRSKEEQTREDERIRDIITHFKLGVPTMLRPNRSLACLSNTELIRCAKAAKQIALLGRAAENLLNKRQIIGTRAHNRAMDDVYYAAMRHPDSETRKIAKEAAPKLRLQRKLARMERKAAC